MEFINQLVERSSMVFSGMRMYNPIQVRENIQLSIQGSVGHYSMPRMLVNPIAYESMEMAILKDGEFAAPDEVFTDTSLIEALEEHFDGQVFSYVPVELIEKVYQSLKA